MKCCNTFPRETAGLPVQPFARACVDRARHGTRATLGNTSNVFALRCALQTDNSSGAAFLLHIQGKHCARVFQRASMRKSGGKKRPLLEHRSSSVLEWLHYVCMIRQKRGISAIPSEFVPFASRHVTSCPPRADGSVTPSRACFELQQLV